MIPTNSQLGKKSHYPHHYTKEALFPLARKLKREEIGIISADLPFFGCDIWNHYEVSWLNNKGKPVVALAQIMFGCDSKNIIESKSMKLYFNSFNNTQFATHDDVANLVKKDLAESVEGSFVDVAINPLHLFKEEKIYRGLSGICLDELDVGDFRYNTDPSYLVTENEEITETLYSDLLKSNCLVTNQPDWCSIQIVYTGKKINHEGLLRYLVSFRNDNEFHEQCIEKIFMHIMQYCQPKELTVYGRSTRRGGLDINSYRSTKMIDPYSILNLRLCRQ